MPTRIARPDYAAIYGPTTGDRIRLGDTDLIIEVERDLTTYGDEVKFGGGKVIRDGMGQLQIPRAGGAVDAVTTNDIYTREDASINLAAVADLNRAFPDLNLILIEPGGDNLAATFSPALADLSIYVIDTAAGQDIPRKRGPGVTRSDLLVVNKTDLAPYVGVDLTQLEADTKVARGQRPYVMARIRQGNGVPEVVA